MKLQNIVLLGFVSSAVEYLNDQFNNDEIGQYLRSLNSEELEKLRAELNARLESSIGVMNNTVETLMKTGSAAFLDFINEENNSALISDILSEGETAESNENDEFLSLISKAAEEAGIFEESIGDIVEEAKPNDDESEEIDALFNEIIENEEGGQQSANDDEMVDTLLEELKNQLEQKSEEMVEEEVDPTPALYADALSALMSQNDSIEKYLEELSALEEFVNEEMEEQEEEAPAEEETAEESEEQQTESLVDLLSQVDDVFSGLFDEEAPAEDTVPEETVETEEAVEEAVEEETPAEEAVEEEAPVEETPLEETTEEPAETEETVEEAEEAVEETSEPEAVEETVEEEVAEEEPVAAEEVTQQEYVSDLIEELKRKLAAEEENKKKVPTIEDIYQSISEMYPHLSRSFIRSVYDLKETIAVSYPLDRKVIVLHRLVFTSLENLRSFVECVLGSNYTVNVDERKMIVDTFKEHTNTDGKILANIFEISNLAKGLGGDYEGYRVIVKEDE